MTEWFSKAVIPLFVTLFLAGCSSASAGGEIAVIEVEVPLKEPAWVDGEEVVLAIAQDEPRIARVSAEGGVDYRRFDEELGDTITPNSEDTRYAYLPQPESGRVAVLDTATLETVDAFDLGFRPVRTTLDAQSEVLFVLSEDGRTVAGTHLEEEEGAFPTVEVGGAELLEAPEKGLYPAFWVAGPDEVSYYAGEPPERLVEASIAAKDITADLSVAQRAYVAEEGSSGRVVAFEGDPDEYLEGDLVATAELDLDGTVEHLASDELHVFAAMEGKVVAMRRESLEVVQSVEFGGERGSLSDAIPSGVAVGTDNVYVTLEGEPYIISVEKP